MDKIQYLNIVDGPLEDSCFAEFVTTHRILLLTGGHKFLQRAVALFNGVAALLLRLSVGLASSFFVAFGALAVAVLVI